MTGTILTVDISQTEPDFHLEAAFTLSAGITALIGRSGSGKTMLLDTLAGLRTPHHGAIKFGTACLLDTQAKINEPPEKRHIGYVFQSGRLMPHLSVEGNLHFGSQRARQNTPLASSEEIISLLDLKHLLARRPHHLSGGERQRVAIGRALLSAPRLILMDEPLANLDPARRAELMPFLERIHQRFALPILYVSHNMEEVLRLADKVLVLKNGKLKAQGPVADVLNDPKIQQYLLGSTSQFEPETILEVHAQERDGNVLHLKTALGIFTLPHSESMPPTPRLRIQARDVILSKVEVSGLSIRNALACTIKTIRPVEPGQVDIELLATTGEATPQERSFPLWARITQAAASDLKLSENAPCWAYIKASALIPQASKVTIL
ncbi:MAG: molybdenum ABC transporter ATP-binding protein [Parvibaculaceae bacterium]|nr:molybdenum ABC transporter ATP-binding protein [Parvibaculaceae bacterium]